MKYKPHKYQKHAIKLIEKQTQLGLFLDPGLGKTSIVLSAFKSLKTAGQAKTMLVVAPLIPMYTTWADEIAKWDNLKGLSYGLLHGKNKSITLSSKFDIYLINPEGLIWLVKEIKHIKKFPFDILVIDESHKFKNTRSKRFKLLKSLLAKFESRYILTGSPVPNGMLDLFGQIYILDEGEALGQYITHYRETYFYPTGYMGYDWQLREGSNEAIHKQIEHIVLRLSAEDYLDIPSLVVVDHWIDLPKHAMNLYHEMEKECILQLKKGVVTAVNAGVLTGKLRQIANGGVYHSETNLKTFDQIHMSKANLVQELVEELSGQQVLISYEFRHDLARIQKACEVATGVEPPYIGSGVTASKKKKIIEEFQIGKTQVIIGHPSSMALGGNLQNAYNIIMPALPWSLDNYDQFIRRVWRQGQTRSVILHRILAKDTVDKVIVEALNNKNRTQQGLLNLFKKSVGV